MSTIRQLTFAVSGPIGHADLALLAASGASLLDCDVSTVEPDAVTVNALARLQLAAQNYGCRVRLRNASSELAELIAFMGLDDVLR